jgi:hypothetical protein
MICVYKANIAEINFILSWSVTIKFVLLEGGGEGISLCLRVSTDQAELCHKCGPHLKII